MAAPTGVQRANQLTEHPGVTAGDYWFVSDEDDATEPGRPYAVEHTDAVALFQGTLPADVSTLDGRVTALESAPAATFGEYAGAWAPSGGSFPGGSVDAAGDWFNATDAGTIDSTDFVAGDILVALVDSPSTTVYAANWTTVPAPAGSPPAASKTVAGIIEIATGTETDAGTDDVRALTPARLANSALAASVAASLTPIRDVVDIGDIGGTTEDIDLATVNSADVSASSSGTLNVVAGPAGKGGTAMVVFGTVVGTVTVTGVDRWLTPNGVQPNIVTGSVLFVSTHDGVTYGAGDSDTTPRSSAETTVVLSDWDRWHTRTGASVTIPTDATLDLPLGYEQTLVAGNAAGLTLTVTGLTIIGALVACAQDEILVIKKLAADTWAVVGGTA